MASASLIMISELYGKRKLEQELARVSASGYHQISGGGVFINNSYIRGEERKKPAFPLFIYLFHKKSPQEVGLLRRDLKQTIS